MSLIPGESASFADLLGRGLDGSKKSKWRASVVGDEQGVPASLKPPGHPSSVSVAEPKKAIEQNGVTSLKKPAPRNGLSPIKISLKPGKSAAKAKVPGTPAVSKKSRIAAIVSAVSKSAKAVTTTAAPALNKETAAPSPTPVAKAPVAPIMPPVPAAPVTTPIAKAPVPKPETPVVASPAPPSLLPNVTPEAIENQPVARPISPAPIVPPTSTPAPVPKATPPRPIAQSAPSLPATLQPLRLPLDPGGPAHRPIPIVRRARSIQNPKGEPAAPTQPLHASPPLHPGEGRPRPNLIWGPRVDHAAATEFPPTPMVQAAQARDVHVAWPPAEQTELSFHQPEDTWDESPIPPRAGWPSRLKGGWQSRFVRFLTCECVAIFVLVASALIGMRHRLPDDPLNFFTRVLTIASAVVAVVIPVLFYGLPERLPRGDR